MELTPEQMKAGLCAQLAQNPVLPDAPTGPLLPQFSALELAQAIEAEMQSCAVTGYNFIGLKMNLTDAQAMAAFLRRAVSKGA